jgi:hypothetical protein
VANRYNGNSDELVKLPDGWEIDRKKTAELRQTKHA